METHRVGTWRETLELGSRKSKYDRCVYLRYKREKGGARWKYRISELEIM
jgi:hypothetical protein